MWNHLSVFTKVTAPYYYPIEALRYREGELFKLIRNWGNRGIDVTITLTNRFDSPLCSADYADYLEETYSQIEKNEKQS